MKSILTSVCAILFTVSISAQIPLTSTGYFNNFDSYVGTFSSLPTGWTSLNSNFLGISTGLDAVGGSYAYGENNDYSLGGLRSEAQTNIGYEVSFVNSTSQVITDLEISYDFEQWRYSNNSGIYVTSTLGNVSGLGQAVVEIGTNGIPTIIGKSVVLSNLSLAPNQSFTITFIWNDEIGTNNGFGIDNFTISSILLPIRLEKYGLDHLDNKVNVLWTTSEESNNSHFTVEHSLDGKNFTTLGRVNAKLDRSGERDYTYSHSTPAKGINYYRLNQFDLDGTKTTFNILSIDFKGSGDRFLFPTATDSQIFLSGFEDGMVRVFDATGRSVLQSQYVKGSSLDVGNLVEGTYILTLGTEKLSFIKI